MTATRSISIGLFVAVLAFDGAAQPAGLPLPEGAAAHRDLACVLNGHERQKLDLYLPQNGSNLPLIVNIHGGAFRAGSKEQGVPVTFYTVKEAGHGGFKDPKVPELTRDPFTHTTRAHGGPSYLPAGDPWIVYPGKDAPLDSIRFEAMRDGIADYELLCLLAEENPDAARRLVGQHVLDFDRYETDVATFRVARRELLQLVGQSGGR